MTDKERLEEIKSRVWRERCTYAVGDDSSREGYRYTLSDEDYHWLVKQAEKVEQLQQENEQLKKLLNWEQEEAQGLDEEVTFQLEQLKQAQAKIERYEKALREIAINCDTTPFNYIAKQALEGDRDA